MKEQSNQCNRNGSNNTSQDASDNTNNAEVIMNCIETCKE